MSFPRYQHYKPSHLEWLADLPEHWSDKRIKFIASLNDDVLPEDTDPGYEMDYVDIGRVCLELGITQTESILFSSAPSRARRRVRHGDVLISTVRTYLKAIASVHHPPTNLIVSTGFAVVRPGQFLDPEFAGYALQEASFIDQIIARSTGVNYPAITATELGNICVPLPSRDEQRAIGQFLYIETAKIDALVEEQRRLIALLTEKRQAVISHAITKGLNHDSPMKPSGIEWLGEIPASWSVKRLKHISPHMTVGIVVNPSTYVAEEGLPFIYGGDIQEGFIDWENARRIKEKSSNENVKTRLRAGDLLTVRVGAPGITAVVPPECEGGNCASVMLVRQGDFNSRWLCYAMNTRAVRFQVEVVQYGAAQEQFNISHAVNFWCPVPPHQEQNRIADFLDHESSSIVALINEASHAIDLLQERRSALISAAVTGKIDVRQAVLEPVA
jgi:type I restriction enzyme, S subunit